MTLPPPPTANIATVTQELSDGEVDRLLAGLVSLLPYSIPLTRRLQHHKRNPSPTAHVLLTSFLPPNGKHVLGDTPNPEEENKISHPIPPDSRTTWLAAYVDLATPGQTQSWVFASWELPNSQTDAVSEQDIVFALFRHIYDHLVPAQPTEPSLNWLWLRDNGKNLSLPYNRNKVLFGTVHERVFQYFPHHAITRVDASYRKYIFDCSAHPTQPPVGLPEGYVLGSLTDDQLQTVLDRSPIPRTATTLKSMQNIGIYHGTRFIAWGFLGLDDSICSMHTESEYRGRGFAVTVARELMRKQATLLGDGAGGYAHADVSKSNVASSSVMKKLHGQVMWSVAWVELDLEEALQAATAKP